MAVGSNATFAQGTILARETTAGSGVYTTIAEVRSISGPEGDRDEIDVTHQQSPDRHRQYIAGIRDSGSLTFDLNFDPNHATHNATTGLLADQVSGTVKNYKITFPTTPAVAYVIPAFVKKFGLLAPVDGVLAANLELRVASAPTLTGVTP